MSATGSQQENAAQVGSVLGMVSVIMGIAYGNQGLLIIGGIVLVIGIGARMSARRGRDTSGSDSA